MKIKAILTGFLMLFSTLGAIEYEIQDIGTIHTHSSRAIALNNQGQILGWYNIDGSNDDKIYFIRDKDGNFQLIPKNEVSNGPRINWQYLTDNGDVYGKINEETMNPTLFVWNSKNNIMNLGVITGNILTINNKGQVLIHVPVNENGKSTYRSAIWHNGQLNYLKGAPGNLGIESDIAQGNGMNNFGDVVGYSTVYLNYKNKVYQQQHATKWVNGQAIDLNNTVPVGISTVAIGINDLGEVLFNEGYFINKDGKGTMFESHMRVNKNYLYHLNSSETNIYHKNGTLVTNRDMINSQIKNNINSIWTSVYLGMVNDNGEIIGQGRTIYGEDHAIILKPKTK